MIVHGTSHNLTLGPLRARWCSNRPARRAARRTARQLLFNASLQHHTRMLRHRNRRGETKTHKLHLENSTATELPSITWSHSRPSNVNLRCPAPVIKRRFQASGSKVRLQSPKSGSQFETPAPQSKIWFQTPAQNSKVRLKSPAPNSKVRIHNRSPNIQHGTRTPVDNDSKRFWVHNRKSGSEVPSNVENIWVPSPNVPTYTLLGPRVCGHVCDSEVSDVVHTGPGATHQKLAQSCSLSSP